MMKGAQAVLRAVTLALALMGVVSVPSRKAAQVARKCVIVSGRNVQQPIGMALPLKSRERWREVSLATG